MKDAAVHRLAKSITQLTLCQVTTSEVDDATKLLEKACQKLQGIQNIPSQRVTDLEAAIRQLRQIGCQHGTQVVICIRRDDIKLSPCLN